MSQPHAEEPNSSHSCGCASSCGPESIAVAQPKPEPEGIPVFRIPTMDCATEEGEIRHALANLPGLRSLSFQLGARTLAIDASAESIPQALDAIRKAGFKPAHCLIRRGKTMIMTTITDTNMAAMRFLKAYPDTSWP